MTDTIGYKIVGLDRNARLMTVDYGAYGQALIPLPLPLPDLAGLENLVASFGPKVEDLARPVEPDWSPIEGLVGQARQVVPMRRGGDLFEGLTGSARKLAELAYVRWQNETGGMALPDGTRVATDRESQALVANAIRLLEERAARGETDPTTEFKAVSGWTVLDLPALREVGYRIGLHVDACFRHERDLSELVVAADEDETALAAIDLQAGWPG